MYKKWKKSSSVSKINPKQAIALTYEERSMETPVVSASARGERASNIIRLARRYGIPISHNQKLTNSLGGIAIDQEIPTSTYEEVARLFCEISRTSKSTCS